MSGRHAWKILGFSVAVVFLLTVPSVSSAADRDMLETFWQGHYGKIQIPKDDLSVYKWDLLAKAKVDECYYGLQDFRNRESFNAIYPDDFTPAQIDACINDGGKPKVNQAYVWGLAKAGDNVWFGTVANTLCLVFGGFYGPMTPPPMENQSWVCEMGFKDVRPPRIFMYNMKTQVLTDKTPQVLTRSDTDATRLKNTSGLRSAGTYGGVVFLGGIATGGVTMFAFNAYTGDYLGSIQYGQYNNIRQWRVIKKELYTGVGKRRGGEVLRWTGSLINPFQFETVGDLTGDPAYLVEHKGRIFSSSWGGPADSGGTVLYMSPELGSDQKLTEADANHWQIVWKLSDYEVEPAAFQVGGALESYGDHLYWGTMHVPATGLVYFSQLYPGASLDTAAFLGTYRPIVIFRGKQFDKPKQKSIELLYGTSYLPKYNKDAAQWEIVPNNMGQHPKYGLAGFNNFFNNYTWYMMKYHGKLFVGTMDWLYLGGVIAESMGVDIPESIHRLAKHFDGADLWAFVSQDLPAFPVAINGMGNYLNYGIRTMFADDFLYIGTANPMNLETTPGKPEGGWELYKLYEVDLY